MSLLENENFILSKLRFIPRLTKKVCLLTKLKLQVCKFIALNCIDFSIDHHKSINNVYYTNPKQMSCYPTSEDLLLFTSDQKKDVGLWST